MGSRYYFSEPLPKFSGIFHSSKNYFMIRIPSSLCRFLSQFAFPPALISFIILFFLQTKISVALPPPDDSVNCEPAMSIQWQKSFGGAKKDIPWDLCTLSSGGCVVVGQSASTNGDVNHSRGVTDYWVIKLDSLGNIVWNNSFGGTSKDEAYAVEACTDGGFIVAGGTRSKNLDVTNNHGAYDFWIVKLKSNGSLDWQKSFGGPDIDVAYDVKQTTDGGYIAVGYAKSKTGDVTSQKGKGDYWIVKMDGLGNMQWQKSYGGSQYDFAHAVALTADGGYLVSGYARSGDGDVNGNNGEEDLWLIKLDGNGNLIWQSRYGDEGGEGTTTLALMNDGIIYSVGISHSNEGLSQETNGAHDYWLVKMDSSGVLEWTRCFGGTASDDPQYMAPFGTNQFILAGNSSSTDKKVCTNHGGDDGWLLAVDSSGNMLWQISLGGTLNESANAVEPTTDGGFLVACNSNSNNGDVSGNHGNDDYWIVKLRPVAQRIVIVSDDAVDVAQTSTIRFYPNPGTGNFTVEFSDGADTENGTVELFSMDGRLVFSSSLEFASGKAPLTIDRNVAGGYYFAKVTAGNRVYVHPLLLKR